MAPNGSLGPQILGGCFFVLYAIFGLWHTVFALLHPTVLWWKCCSFVFEFSGVHSAAGTK
jgi:hypothetical protein